MKVNLLRSLRFALLSALVVLSLTLIPPQRSHAVTGKLGNEFIYYSDATHRTQVGIRIFCSNGQTIIRGQVTQFVVVEPAGC